MNFKFKGVVCEMTPVQQIQGRTRMMNKSTLFVAPTTYDHISGDPTYGTIDEAMPIECIDDAINLAMSVPVGTPVMCNVAIVSRTILQQDGTRKGFVSLKLLSITPEQQPAQGAQMQQPVQGSQQMPPQQPQGYAPQPFKPY